LRREASVDSQSCSNCLRIDSRPEPQIFRTDDLDQTTPNLVFDSSVRLAGNSSAVEITIRGIGQTDPTLTFGTRTQDGYIDYPALGKKLGDTDTYTITGKLRRTPADAFDVRFMADFTQADENGTAIANVALNPTGACPRKPGPATPAPALTQAVLDPARKVAAKLWPGIPLVPSMATDATDGRFLNAAGLPTYGLTGMFLDPDGNGVHGLNERIRARSLYEGREFLYEVIKLYANGRAKR
jgi:hypothetical protein